MTDIIRRVLYSQQYGNLLCHLIYFHEKGQKLQSGWHAELHGSGSKLSYDSYCPSAQNESLYIIDSIYDVC